MGTGEIAADVNVTDVSNTSEVRRKVPPWYRHRWPWLFMSGPAIVVVAGVITMVIAFRTSDGLVEDDYYKQGLAINKMLERDAGARAMGLGATVRFGAGNGRVRVAIDSGDTGAGALRLKLLHPTRAGLDQVVDLVQIAPGLWEGALTPPARGLWRLQLDTPDGGWRIGGDWQSGADGAVLRPQPSAGAAP